MKKLLLLFTLITSLALLVVGCGSNEQKASTNAPKEIRVGVTAGPHEQVTEFVAKEAEKQGLKVKVVPFQDYVTPNVALDQKELELNSMQHQPFLDNAVKDKGFKLVSIGKSILLPMAIFSDKYKNLADIPNGATVAIPNDPTNGGRGLLLLQQAKLITLKEGVGVKATVGDITSNPKNLQIKELDAAQIVHSLKDVDVATVNTNYAVQAGLNPQKDAVLVESKDSPYANVIVVREADKDNETYKKFVQIYQTQATKDFIQKTFNGSILPAF